MRARRFEDKHEGMLQQWITKEKGLKEQLDVKDEELATCRESIGFLKERQSSSGNKANELLEENAALKQEQRALNKKCEAQAKKIEAMQQELNAAKETDFERESVALRGMIHLM